MKEAGDPRVYPEINTEPLNVSCRTIGLCGRTNKSKSKQKANG